MLAILHLNIDLTMKTFLFPLFVCLSLILSACGTKPTQTLKVDTPPPALTAADQPEELISKALNTNSPRLQSQLFFQASQQYWENNLLSQSDAALASVHAEHLNAEQVPQYVKMTLTFSTRSENKKQIEKTISLIPPNGFQQLNVGAQIDFAQLLSKAYEMLNFNIEAAITLIDNRGLLDQSQLPLYDERIWNLLRSTETSALSQFNYSGDNSHVLAWLDLARTIQLNQIDLNSQYNALQTWNTLWPNHPASLAPPRELKILQQLPTTRPDSIVLALPLTGPLQSAGKAIRDGFMAMYYAQKSKHETITVQFFDTAKNDILELYSDQQNNTNNLIVGPLDKHSLKAINSLEHITTPTLALNYLPQDHEHSKNLYQFGLAPETEATQLADHLSNKNFKRVGLILPQNNLGFRIFDSFSEHFSTLEGVIVEHVYYENQASLSSSVARLLGTEASKSRKSKVQKITQTPMEFLPRRRQDIDALVMIAKPEIARQIKPLFSFHYASNLPVFSSSQVHTPSEKGHNADLNGIEFIEMPWMLSNTIDIKSELKQAIPESHKQYTRFYALGADSFSLAPRLRLLQEVQGSQMQGHTGTLSMNHKGVINRKMEWARFKKGKAIIIKEK